MSLKLSDTRVYEPYVRARLGHHNTPSLGFHRKSYLRSSPSIAPWWGWLQEMGKNIGFGGRRWLRSYMKCVSIGKISGNEVYCTMFLMLLVKIMLCSKLHSQIFKIKNKFIEDPPP